MLKRRTLLDYLQKAHQDTQPHTFDQELIEIHQLDNIECNKNDH